MVSIGTLTAFIVVSVGVIILRIREPDLPRGFKVPGYPVTPIVLMFQRALYAKLDNPKVIPTALDPKANQILPHWHLTGYLAYLGYSFVIGGILLVLAIFVFGRSEANFAEEL